MKARHFKRTCALVLLFILVVGYVQVFQSSPRLSSMPAEESSEKHHYNQLATHPAINVRQRSAETFQVMHVTPSFPVANYSDSWDQLESQKMHKYLELHPRLLKAAICLLVQASRKEMLMRLLNQLHTNFNHRYGYPVLLFHEAEFQSLRSQVRANNTWGHQVFFQTVHFKLPDFHEKRFGSAANASFCLWRTSLGYRHMCRFHSIVFYEQPALLGLEYYWRLDDDSQLLRPFAADPFQLLRDSGAEYGYALSSLDSPLCTHNLWNLTRRFIAEHQLRPTFFDKMPENFQFFNNFEVSRLRLWRSPEYRSFVDAIDQHGGIYRYRWGDAPIKTLALSLFVRPEKIAKFINTGHKHWLLKQVPLKMLEQIKLSV